MVHSNTILCVVPKLSPQSYKNNSTNPTCLKDQINLSGFQFYITERYNGNDVRGYCCTTLHTKTTALESAYLFINS